MRRAVEYARNNNIWVVAAAGNYDAEMPEAVDLNQYPLYPICFRDDKNYPLAIGVGSIDEDGGLSAFSNFGSRCVLFSAQGSNIASTLYFDPAIEDLRYLSGSYLHGTSFAAPMVTGALAYAKSINPTLTAKQQLDFLLASSENIDNLNPSLAGHIGSGFALVADMLSG